MNAKELAALLNGREYLQEITDEEAERYAVGDIMDLVVLKGGK